MRVALCLGFRPLDKRWMECVKCLRMTQDFLHKNLGHSKITLGYSTVIILSRFFLAPYQGLSPLS